MTSTNYIYFTANKPHEGPQEFLCIMREITFSDGIKRFIGISDETPESAWPDIVYKRNEIEGGYDKIGIYRTTEIKSTQWFNSRTNHWVGDPSIKIYTFIPQKDL